MGYKLKRHDTETVKIDEPGIYRLTDGKIEKIGDAAPEKEMKVSMTKSVGFYAKAVKSFLHGVEAKSSPDGKEEVSAKDPVDSLRVAGLGNACAVAVAVAAKVEKDGTGVTSKVQTSYPE